MAKKKEIKLESQQTRGAGPGADPSDPVAIIYKDELIGSLNDTDDEGVLKTGGTICEDDIFVRYAGDAYVIKATFHNPAETIYGEGSLSAETPIAEILSAIEAGKHIFISADVTPSDLVGATSSVFSEMTLSTATYENGGGGNSVEYTLRAQVSDRIIIIMLDPSDNTYVSVGLLSPVKVYFYGRDGDATHPAGCSASFLDLAAAYSYGADIRLFYSYKDSNDKRHDAELNADFNSSFSGPSIEGRAVWGEVNGSSLVVSQVIYCKISMSGVNCTVSPALTPVD